MQETGSAPQMHLDDGLGGIEPLYQPDRSHPPAPGLHFVATPIGAARDITLRALDLLATADVLAAEDTRTLRHLMEIHRVRLGDRPLIAYHDHNGAAQRPRLMALLAAGKSIAYASEAGTPLIADPGFQLGRATLEAGFRVFAAPGPSAVLAALTVSGLPTDRFLFAGFVPPAGGARQRFLSDLADTRATLVQTRTRKEPSCLRSMIANCRSWTHWSVCLQRDGGRPCAGLSPARRRSIGLRTPFSHASSKSHDSAA